MHAYKEPGQYTVTCYLYDVNGESYYDTFQQKVNIYNYLTDSITLSAPSTQTLRLTASQLLTPVLVSRSTSWQYYETSAASQTTVRDLPTTDNSFFAIPQKHKTPTEPYKDTRTFNLTKPVTLTTFISGAAAPNYFDLNLQNTHYGHLYPYSSAFIFASGSNGTTEFVEVSSIETTSTPVYVTLSGNSIVHTSSDNISAYFVGTSGSQLMYYKDDMGGVKSNILIGFDSNTIKPFSNTSTVGYSVSVTPNTNYSYLSITANGLDSEGTSSNLFPINTNKFNNTKIAFVVKLKDSKGFSIKSAPILTPTLIALRDQNNTSYTATFSADFGSLSALSTGGFCKFYCVPQLVITKPKQNMVLYAQVTTINGVVSGISNTFDIYPENYYNIAKKGEDIDFTAKFTEIATQPLFQDTPILINEFLGSIFGNISSSQDSLGKVTYEKIKNFVDNNATLDYSNIEQFLSILKQFDSEEYDFGLTSIAAPVELTRLIDLLSINYSRLRGTLNQFSENFEPNGYVNNTYSLNLGQELNTQTYIITAGVDIVAYEKYSKQYHKINTSSLSSLNAPLTTFRLSAYNDSWGWNLVLPRNSSFAIDTFYKFYEYVYSIEGSHTNNIINYDDPNNTLQYTQSSYTAWAEQDGIISNIISNKLYDKLNLFV